MYRDRKERKETGKEKDREREIKVVCVWGRWWWWWCRCGMAGGGREGRRCCLFVCFMQRLFGKP